MKTETKHTPEPWTRNTDTVNNTNRIISTHPGYGSIGHTPIYKRADADRIVACVNACAGIDPAAVPELIKGVSYVLEKLRDIARETTRPHDLDSAIGNTEARREQAQDCITLLNHYLKGLN